MRNKKTVMRAIAMVAVILLVAGMLVMFTGCEEGNTSEHAGFERVIIRLPDDTLVRGDVEGKYADSNGSVRITIDGVEYYTHISNVVVIKSNK